MDSTASALDAALARRQQIAELLVTARAAVEANNGATGRSIQGACGGGWRQGQRCGRRSPQLVIVVGHGHPWMGQVRAFDPVIARHGPQPATHGGRLADGCQLSEDMPFY